MPQLLLARMWPWSHPTRSPTPENTSRWWYSSSDEKWIASPETTHYESQSWRVQRHRHTFRRTAEGLARCLLKMLGQVCVQDHPASGAGQGLPGYQQPTHFVVRKPLLLKRLTTPPGTPQQNTKNSRLFPITKDQDARAPEALGSSLQPV